MTKPEMKYFFLLLFCFLSFQSISAQPQNDDCEAAIDLGVLPYCESTLFSNIAATPSNIGENNIPDCFNGGSIENDVWFKFTIPEDGNSRNFKITIAGDSESSIQNPQLAVYRGACEINELSELGICQSAETGENSLILEAIGLKTNTQYFLRINDYSPSTTPNWGNFSLCIETLAPFFNMGESAGTGLCEGTLFDSGGRTGDYRVNEDSSFTICPTAFHRCIEINVESYDIEKDFDFLTIYEGTNISGQALTSISGTGWQTLAYAKSECITVQFTSDGSQNGGGFRLNWKCLVEDCPVIDPTTCDAPEIINQIPFQATNLTTCFAGDNIEVGPCGTDDFLGGQEYIFAYDSPGGECIAVNITGLIPETGIAIIKGCPERGDGICIEQKEVGNGLDHIFLPNVALKEKGLYYFLIANEANCTPFDIDITTSLTCPNTFPSAANCEDALILNGCNPALPAALTVERGAGDPDFFKFGVNNGCWDGVFATNYTWFTFEAQGDGEFAFLLSNNDPNGTVDIDFNIWGPFDNKTEACFGSDNFQPIRSSWADDLIYSVTGLANINPELGTPVTSTCEGAFGEGFVKPLQVKKGEVYVVMINDFDGVIFSGAIEIDFSGSDAEVLSSLDGNISMVQDTFICEGSSIELTTQNASAYDWSPTESLSCRTCPNPIATPTETTTYTLNARTVCNTITEEITIEVIKANAGVDQTVCQGAIVQLNAPTNFSQVQYQWTSLNGASSLSCTDCPNPTIQANTAGIFDYVVAVSRANCITIDTMTLTVIDGQAPSYSIADNQQICLGMELDLGGAAIANQQYEWTSSDGIFSSMEANPAVTPNISTTYYLSVSTNNCSVSTKDSVVVEVNQNPIVTLRNDTTVCQSTPVLLGNMLIENDVLYEWEAIDIMTLNQPTSANPIATPTATSTYTLTATRGACTTRDTIIIEVLPIAVSFQNQADAISLCLGTSLDLNIASTPENIAVQISTLDGLFQSNESQLFLTPTIHQTYIAKIEFDGCEATDTLGITVDSLPIDRIILPSDTTICQGTELVLSSPIYDPQFYPNLKHQWLGDAGFITSDSFYNVVISPLDTLTLRRIDKNGACIDTVFSTINVLPFIDVAISAQDALICEGGSTDLLADLPAGAENISWTPTENISCLDCPNPQVTPNQTTLYTLSGTLDNCPLMGTIEVETINFSNTQIINHKSPSIFIGQSVDSIVLESNLTTIENIEWFENGQLIEGAIDSSLTYIPLANEPISMENRTVLIEAKITTIEGCTYTAETTIIVKPPLVPNVFTPNNDQQNDFFNILLANRRENIAVFKVYNRWGKLMYDNDDPEKGWNGGLRNKLDDLMPAAVYVYVIQYRVDQQIESVKGNVTLIR